MEFILNHPAFTSPTPVMVDTGDGNKPSDFGSLESDLVNFAKSMKDYHWKSLNVIFTESDQSLLIKRLDDISSSALITREQLIDELNEIALESIADIIIDTTQDDIAIEEEDYETIKSLLHWAYNGKLVSE